jgi:hypothetical protein
MGIIQVPVTAVIMYLEAIRFQAENWPKPIGLRLSKKNIFPFYYTPSVGLSKED